MAIVNKETGELIDERFVKLYVEAIGKIAVMTKGESAIFGVLVRDCKYGNIINLTPKKKKTYVKELGLSSLNSFNTMLKRLENKGIVLREEEGSTSYLINPKLVFKGNDYQHAALLTRWDKGEIVYEVINLKELRNVLNKTNP